MTTAKTWKGYLIYTLVFSITSIILMLGFARHKEIILENIAREIAVREFEATQAAKVVSPLELLLKSEGNAIRIPVPAETKSGQIAVENHYMEHELWVHIDTLTKEYVLNNPIEAGDKVLAGEMESSGDDVWLRFSLDRLYEYQIVLEKDALSFKLRAPKSVYERIVVLDAQEDAVSQSLVRKLKKRLEEEQILVYFTGVEHTGVPKEEKRILLEQAQADFYVGIRVSASGDPEDFGTCVYYAGDYFSPELDAVRLADALERNIVEQIHSKPLGIEASKEYLMLGEATIPSAVISPGFTTHSMENYFLNTESYQDRIVDGMASAILSIYEGMRHE